MLVLLGLINKGNEIRSKEWGILWDFLWTSPLGRQGYLATSLIVYITVYFHMFLYLSLLEFSVLFLSVLVRKYRRNNSTFSFGFKTQKECMEIGLTKDGKLGRWLKKKPVWSDFPTAKTIGLSTWSTCKVCSWSEFFMLKTPLQRYTSMPPFFSQSISSSQEWTYCKIR